MKKILTLLFTYCLFQTIAQAQTTAPVNGLSDEREISYAFKNARVCIDASTVIENATLLIRKDRIIAVGTGVAIPADAVVYDLKGKSVYPAFIDMYTTYGQTTSGKDKKRGESGPQVFSNTKGAYNWNQAIKPEYDTYRNFVIDTKKASDLRKMGFGTVLTLSDDGIARGTAAIVELGESKESEMLLIERAAACYSFNKGSSGQDYPSSLMGSIALLRQTYYDADWYKKAIKKSTDISLESWIGNQLLPQIFEVTDYLSALRADKIGDEFGINYIIKGAGDEYRRVDEIKKAGNAFIIPLTFPKAYDVVNPYDALNISTGELKSWELAPANASILNKAGVKFAITSYGSKDGKEFIKNLLKAVQYGLPKDQALRALTQTPAELLKIADKTGSLKTGLQANFFICSKDFFDKENTMLETWVAGKRYVIKEADSLDFRGKYRFEMDTLKGWNLITTGDQLNSDWTLQKDSSTKIKVDFDRDGQQITLKFELKKGKGAYRLNGMLSYAGSKILSGDGQSPDGTWMKWKATWYAMGDSAKKDTSKKDLPVYTAKPWYPNIAFGFDSLPTTHAILIQHATVWTNESDGILTDADVLINNGKIERVGKGIDAGALKISGLEIIDGTGKHVTAGIIDEHSHIAISSGVNEGTQSITSEVRIGDVINPDDINIYRQLAGGVTSSHLLHGSANAVGGQTILVKLRWGKGAEAMKFEGADGFIKFALGENVKQSNWGDNNTIRYPQTRMGVEQIYIDGFTRAKEYDQRWKSFSSLKDKSKGDVPRRDLELDALAEILNSKRFITCHSYQQGEINMLMHVADTFGFKINTFTHILEGYKVADKMKAHGAGASSFADWWAYKYEVIEAIPYNGAILNKVGVTTAFNSDDAEMARRLNQEAAKAVKYGNVSEEEALKFVTLNPAKLLHVDNRVGSIKAGKDADLVIWNDNPLSVYAKPLQTFVDGICYYDIVRDEQLRKRNEQERLRIIREMIEDKASGSSTQKPAFTLEQLFHCNDMENLPH